MTVTKERRPTYIFYDSNTSSETESLHLPTPASTDVESDVDSVVSSSSTALYKQLLKSYRLFRQSVGRRKQRRLFNQLWILEEEIENDVQLMEDYQSPFARVLADASALQLWDTFVELSEEQQKQLTEFVPKVQHCTQSESKIDNHQPKISSRIKRAMKVKKNLQMEMVEKIEREVVDYFNSFPQGVFISVPPTSFERLLIHAIAHYHHLKSISVINIAIRSVEVTCTNEGWKPMEVSFCSFAKELNQ